MRIQATAKGQLQPALEGKAMSLANAKLDKHPMITESAPKVLALLPSLMGAPAAALARAMGPMDVPGPQGMKLVVDSSSVALVDKSAAGTYEMLGVFARMPKK